MLCLNEIHSTIFLCSRRYKGTADLSRYRYPPPTTTTTNSHRSQNNRIFTHINPSLPLPLPRSRLSSHSHAHVPALPPSHTYPCLSIPPHPYGHGCAYIVPMTPMQWRQGYIPQELPSRVVTSWLPWQRSRENGFEKMKGRGKEWKGDTERRGRG